MSLDPQVSDFYKEKIAQKAFAQTNYDVLTMRQNADAVFNDKELIFPIYHWEDRQIPGPNGFVPIRIYRPGGMTAYPVMVYFHGGGFIMHNIASHDALCRKLAVCFDCIVVSVGYRLAPEHPYPACIEDGEAALLWVYNNARSFQGDPTQLMVAGDSSGATISAALSLLSRDKRGPKISLQLLFYGMFGAVSYDTSPSMAAFGTGEYVLPRTMIEFCSRQFVPKDTDLNDPYLYPGKSPDLTGLPKTIAVTAQYDPLKDDGDAFATKLSLAGNSVTLITADGMMHGFLLYWYRFQRAQILLETIGTQVRTFFNR